MSIKTDWGSKKCNFRFILTTTRIKLGCRNSKRVIYKDRMGSSINMSLNCQIRYKIMRRKY